MASVSLLRPPRKPRPDVSTKLPLLPSRPRPATLLAPLFRSPFLSSQLLVTSTFFADANLSHRLLLAPPATRLGAVSAPVRWCARWAWVLRSVASFALRVPSRWPQLQFCEAVFSLLYFRRSMCPARAPAPTRRPRHPTRTTRWTRTRRASPSSTCQHLRRCVGREAELTRDVRRYVASLCCFVLPGVLLRRIEP